MRGYVSTGTGEISTLPLLPLLADHYQLFAERLKPRIHQRLHHPAFEGELRPAMPLARPVLVRVVRSDLSILLSRWLLRTIPRLGPEHHTRITISPGLSSETDPTVELRLEDDGPPLPRRELAAWHELVTAGQLQLAIETRSQSADCHPDGMTTELRLLLPLVVSRKDGAAAEEDRLLGDSK